MSNSFTDACVALVLGIGTGLLLSVGAQKMLNSYYKDTCNARPNHNLIYTQSALGDTYYCIHSKYL